MIRINELYSEPERFDPVIFRAGLNLILGEKDSSSDKTNGVGKSLLIEFINFSLMKDFHRSRLAKIPASDFDPETNVCLDFNINNHHLVSKRNIKDQNTPTIYLDGVRKEFSSIDDAIKFLSLLFFKDEKNSVHPSFRSMMGLMIRDERSEFKSIVDCYDTKEKIPTDYAPHLYLFGLDLTVYHKIKNLQKLIAELTTAKNKLANDIETLTNKKIANARSEVNDLEHQVKKIKDEMEALESDNTFDLIRDEVSLYEEKLDELRNKKTVIKKELSKILIISGDNYIDDNEVVELYNRMQAGLGDNIGKELSEVILFKRKIDEFQSVLINSRKNTLASEIESLEKSINEYTKKLTSKVGILKQTGNFRNIKMLFLAYEKKLEEYSQLSSFIKKHDDYERRIKRHKTDKSNLTLMLDISISENKEVISEFQETILSIHEFVAGNRKCSFEITVNELKSVLSFELRIYDDGSHSNEREKVFFYDMSLLLTNSIFIKHPKLLIHDNIFDVDQDTLIKSLNYLSSKSSCLKDAQYILTLNSDKINDIDKKALDLDVSEYKIASLTKNNRFLRKHYQEKK